MITVHAHALNRVVQCNGSVFMEPSEVPDDGGETSVDRREGVAAHWMALEVVAGRFSDPVELVDRKAPNGIWITPEMAEHSEAFINDVRARNAATYTEDTVDFQLSTETYVACRLDLATYDVATHTLTVDDFKYGYRIVEAIDNWQLMAGVMGWIVKYGVRPLRIVMNVHQPRPHHPDGKKRSWEFASYEDFERVYVTRFAPRLAQLTRDLCSGPACYRCPALAHCTAARRAGYNMIDASATVFNDKLSNDDLIIEYETLERAISHAEQLQSAYKELLTHRLTAGNVFQDYALEAQFGNTRFKKGVTASMIAAVSGIKVEKLQETVPLSSAKMIKAGASELIVKSFTERPMTGMKLVKKSASKRAAAMFKPPTE